MHNCSATSFITDQLDGETEARQDTTLFMQKKDGAKGAREENAFHWFGEQKEALAEGAGDSVAPATKSPVGLVTNTVQGCVLMA
jgi:hypothetical protein